LTFICSVWTYRIRRSHTLCRMSALPTDWITVFMSTARTSVASQMKFGYEPDLCICPLCINVWLSERSVRHLKEMNKVVMFASMTQDLNDFSKFLRIFFLDMQIYKAHISTNCGRWESWESRQHHSSPACQCQKEKILFLLSLKGEGSVIILSNTSTRSVCRSADRKALAVTDIIQFSTFKQSGCDHLQKKNIRSCCKSRTVAHHLIDMLMTVPEMRTCGPKFWLGVFN
jgi:hypothetical protein